MLKASKFSTVKYHLCLIFGILQYITLCYTVVNISQCYNRSKSKFIASIFYVLNKVLVREKYGKLYDSFFFF